MFYKLILHIAHALNSFTSPNRFFGFSGDKASSFVSKDSSMLESSSKTTHACFVSEMCLSVLK